MKKKIVAYTALIKYKNNKFQHVAVIKVGSFDYETATEDEKEEDENIFFYIDRPEEIGVLMDKNNNEDFYVLQATPIYEEEETIDLFSTPELLPKNVQKVINKYGEINEYTQCEAMLNELKPLGYTFEYYLDATPFNLKKI